MKTFIPVFSLGIILLSSCGRTPEEDFKLTQLENRLDSLEGVVIEKEMIVDMTVGVGSLSRNGFNANLRALREAKEQVEQTKSDISDLKFLGIW